MFRKKHIISQVEMKNYLKDIIIKHKIYDFDWSNIVQTKNPFYMGILKCEANNLGTYEKNIIRIKKKKKSIKHKQL